MDGGCGLPRPGGLVAPAGATRTPSSIAITAAATAIRLPIALVLIVLIVHTVHDGTRPDIGQVTDVWLRRLGHDVLVAPDGLIGRDREVGLARAVIADAARSRGRALLIEGPPGIGKSVLLDDAASGAEAAGFLTLRASCDEPDAGRPFSLFVELLALGTSRADPRAAAVEALVVEPTTAAPESPADVSDLRVRVADELVGALEALSLDAPLAVVVDDLQWADPASLGVLRQVLRQLDGRRLAVIGAHRPSPIAELVALPGDRVVLAGLGEAEVAALVARRAQAEPGPSLLAITARAGGNPLFVTELVDALFQDERIDVVDGAARARPGELPPSVHATVRRRMAALPRETISMLTIAAVLGEPFSLEELAVVARTEGVAAFTTLSPAVDAAFLQESGDRFDFRHDVVREALYLDLPLPARRAFHLKVARALASANASAPRVARHFALGADRGDEEAAAWLERAAVELAPYAPGVGVDLFQQALDLLGRHAPRRTEILRELTGAAWAAGRFDLCERASAELLNEARDPRARALAHTWRYALFAAEDRYREAIAEMEVALRIDDLPLAARAELLALVCSGYATAGDFARALETANEALELGRSEDVPFARGRALTIHAAAHRAIGAYWEGSEVALDSNAEFVPSAAPGFRTSTSTDRFQAYLYNSAILIDADRFDEAEQSLRAATIGLEDLGHVPLLVLAHRTLAGLLFHAGRWDDALAELETASAASDVPPGGRVIFGDSVPELHLRRGDLATAEGALAEALETVDPREPLPGNAWTARAQAALLEAAGRSGEAIELLTTLTERTAALGLLPDIRAVALPLVRLLVDADRHDEVPPLLDLADEAASRAARVPSVVGAARLCRAIATGEGFDAAIDALRGSPRRHGLALALEDAGARGDGNPAARTARLEEARVLFASFGARHDVERVSSRLRALGVRTGARGPRRTAASGWDSLTVAEMRVVKLLTEGLTNPQIGERLYLSRKTVATHVSSALRKLGASTRTELAAQAAQAARPGA